MKWPIGFLVLVACALTPECVFAKGQAEHVVVVVWDGLRPDSVTPQYTPTLYDLAQRGTFFLNNRCAYVTSTEVNGIVLATGMHPDHSGVMANTQYRPDLNWQGTYGTENLDAVRRGDLLSGGHYLEAATVAEMLQDAGFTTLIAAAKPVGLLHDRNSKKTNQAQKDSVTLFRGQTIPRSALDSLTRAFEIGPFPGTETPVGPLLSNAPTRLSAKKPGSGRGSSNSLDSWTTKALVRGLWKKGVPKYSLLWLSEPDASQHAHGVGSEEAVAALASSDSNLALVIQTLESKGVLDKTDLLVVSDHGFSTIDRGPDVIESLERAKFNAFKQLQNPEPGDILVVNLGGTSSFYVFDRDEAVIRKLVTHLQGTDFAGVIFSALPVEGTFPLSLVRLDTTNGAPDVVVSMRWTTAINENGARGAITAIEGKRGLGTHASLSRFDLHNTLIATGPDFKRGFVSTVPSGNIDVVPTILSVLGVCAPKPLDGRVLYEAMQGEVPPTPEVKEEKLEACRDFGFRRWQQHLKITRVGAVVYFDEGNGESLLK